MPLEIKSRDSNRQPAWPAQESFLDIDTSAWLFYRVTSPGRATRQRQDLLWSPAMMVLDAGLLEHDPLNSHPLDNAMTTAISADGLLRFLEYADHPPRMVELG